MTLLVWQTLEVYRLNLRSFSNSNLYVCFIRYILLILYILYYFCAGNCVLYISSVTLFYILC